MANGRIPPIPSSRNPFAAARGITDEDILRTQRSAVTNAGLDPVRAPLAMNPDVPRGSEFGQQVRNALPMLLAGPGAFGAALTGQRLLSIDAETDARTGRARSQGLQILTDRLSAAGEDPMARRNAILETVSEMGQRPDLFAEDPDIMDALLDAAKGIREGAPQFEDVGPGRTLLSREPHTGAVSVTGATPREPNLFEQKIAMFKDILGMSDAQAVKQASGIISVAQVTDPFTRESFPVIIDRSSGVGQRQDTGEAIPPEQLQQMRDQGLLRGETPVSASLPEGAGQGQPGATTAPTRGTGPTMPSIESDVPLSRLETMTAADASAVGTGSAAAITRGLANVVTAFGVEGAQDELLLEAQATINDINVLGSAYIRDEANTARLAGVTELEQMRRLLPSTGAFTSREENVTNLIRLRSRILRDISIFEEQLAGPTSPEFRKDVEGKLLTLQRMLDRIGSREELFQAREFVRENPQEFERIGRVLGLSAERGTGAATSTLRGASEGAAEAAQGAPDAVFQELMQRDLTQPDAISDEEADQLNLEQVDQLMEERERQLDEKAGGQ